MWQCAFPQFGILEHYSYEVLRVQSVSRSIRQLCKQEDQIPFDPYACATALGIAVDITNLPAGLSGRLRVDFGTPVVELSNVENTVRHRFTLCHELAHLSFLTMKPKLAWERSCSDCGHIDRREERLCNKIAAELLMPTTQFTKYVKRQIPSFYSIQQVADIFGVSVLPAARRIGEDLRIWSIGWAIWQVSGAEVVARKSSRVTIRKGIRSRPTQYQVDATIQRAFGVAEKVMCSNVDCSRPLLRQFDMQSHVALDVDGTTLTMWRGRSSNKIYGIALRN